ncbi:putative quinol monooxygenase [Sphingomonas sp. SUN039]|uniref:putative quinol monooxygenase n=1 Tax=Sphingomonas sp. SUN039 TaxID=2937787 RepID=UPI002164CABA|nr:putative quinol monooxygenase [Sphingomonas sp. SUN039]UVO54207.1 antibiotic biosynthesis monooxygenase [Sphingomonas sp. SUN039]
MIIVTGTVTAREGQFDAVLAIATEHVLRSRAEPGCISHAVHRDSENPNRLFFFERWTDMAALKVHFAVPASGDAVRAMAALTTEPPSMQLYEANEIAGR